MTTAERLVDNVNCNYQMLYFTSTSVTEDRRHLFGMTDERGHWDIFVIDLETREKRILTNNQSGYMKSYVYFDGLYHEGLGKASVSLDRHNKIVYYLESDYVKKTDINGNTTVLNRIPPKMMSAFTHVSEDGKYLCVPVTEERALDYDLDKEGSGCDRRPTISIDKRCIDEDLSSFILVYDTETGELVRNVEIPKCWVTHVQFSPVDSRRILYNNEWTYVDSGIRRFWLLDENDEFHPLREITEGRDREDWVCHEIWTKDGKEVVYHGGYVAGGYFVGLHNLETGHSSEVTFDPTYRSYGHFTLVDGNDFLCCDGYYRDPDDEEVVGKGMTPNESKYITVLKVDWENHRIDWRPLCYHEGEWYDQDSHPHPISDGEYVYFTSRRNKLTNIYRVKI